MSSSKPRSKQHLRDQNRFPSERRQTRRSAKKNQVDVPDVSLEDLEAITRKAREPKLRSSNAKLKSATEKNPGAQQPQPSGTGKSPSPSISPSLGKRQPSGRCRKNRFWLKPQPRSHFIEIAPKSLSPDPESQQHTLVSSWLDVSSPINPDDLEKPDSPSSGLPSFDTRETDIVRVRSESLIVEVPYVPSTKATTRRKANAHAFMQHLEFRGITDKPSNDDFLQVKGVMDKFLQQSDTIKCRQLDSLVKILDTSIQAIKDSVETRPTEDGFILYDSLREKILDWIPDSAEHRRFPPVCASHFVWDQMRCDDSNEADFQRTIMMEIIDRHDFKDKFAFSCAETWSVEPRFLIKSIMENDGIMQPKPDLAISFQRNMIKKPGILAYPIELGSCLHPGIKGRRRWFPFLFLETGGEDTSLRDAFEANLLNASQALSNIYQWMRQIPEPKQKFFDEVRVMTITLTNRDLILRIHRAEKTEGDYLKFKFMKVQDLRYSRFEACHLIKVILHDFALPHLLPILANTYDRVRKLNSKEIRGSSANSSYA